MTKRNIYHILLLFVFIFGGCRTDQTAETGGPLETASPAAEATAGPEMAPTPEPASTPDPVGERIAAMTTEELIGQLLVVGIEGTSPGKDGPKILEGIHPGGIILFGRNVESAHQLAELTNGLKELNRAAGNVPLFLCVDEEGGMVSRMPSEVADLPSAYDYARAEGDSYLRGTALGAECRTFGFHVDFAPSLDVWSNPDNTVIGKRAFGTDAQTVAAAGDSCIQGILDSGVIPVAKHFPGHGDTATDSHVGLPVVDKTLEELKAMELIPFLEAIGGARRTQDPVGKPALPSIPAVMVGHILMTQLDPLLPSSLSPAVVDGLLREDLGFDGVVFTDDLTMGAIANTYPLDQAVVKAVEAGCDMLLVCHRLDNARTAHAALLRAAEEGTVSRSRLEESVRRILELKEAYGVDDSPVELPDVEALNEKIRAILP